MSCDKSNPDQEAVDSAANDSDVSSSDDDEQMTDGSDHELTELRQEIAFNPSYASFEKYVDRLRSGMILDELRQAREDMASRYPLDREIWIQWIEDEKRVSTDYEELEKLYERAVKDFLSVDLWLHYAEFARNSAHVDRARSVYEKALAACGFHFTEGSLIWEAYRDFENDPERKKKLFIRQLSIPLLQMQQTLDEYKEWHQAEFGNLPPDVPSYSKAFSVYQNLLPFEADLTNANDSNVMSVWSSYINSELSAKSVHFNRVHTLFERAIATLFNAESLWRKYILFLRMHSPRNDQFTTLLEACRRATRNCSLSVQLWCEYIVSVSLADPTLDTAKAVYEEALNQPFSSSDAYTHIVLEMCHSQISFTKQLSEVNPDPVRELFEKAVIFDTYSQESVPLTNTTFNLYRYWAEVEASLFEDLDKARNCWDTILKKAGKQAAYWLQYFEFEEKFGSTEKCRSAFRRGVHTFQHDNDLGKIASAWIRFETEHGSIESRDEAVFRTSLLLEKVYAAEQASKQTGTAVKRKSVTIKEKPAKKVKFSSEQEIPTTGQQDSSLAQPNSTVFVLNLPHQVSEKSLRDLFSQYGEVADVRIPIDPRGHTRGFAYVDFQQLSSVQAAIQGANRTQFQGRFISVEEFKQNASRKTSRKHALEEPESPDTKTVFVKGFDKEISQANAEIELRKRFEKYGKVLSIRAPPAARSNRLKGFAYIEFETNNEARSSLVEDGFQWGENVISVEISNPPIRTKEKRPEQRPGLGRTSGFAIPQAPVDRSRRKSVNISHPAAAAIEEKVSGGRSNADFRKMFLKE